MSAAPVDTVGPSALGGRQAAARPFRVLVAGILSAQTKDQAVADAVERLDGLGGGLCASAILGVPDADLADMLHGVSFHKRKAQYLKAVASKVAECGGQVPQSVRELMALPGVGPKIAHLVAQVAFGKVEGIVVDTHVHRICNAIGWASGRTPEQTRRALEAWLPRGLWAELTGPRNLRMR
ncbi:unnamed protein product [Prorocentrum cordatum]|uniref:HhH-GPD domain-containing protein n=1 Tax=Prorocentrum cordatum TaxID=2364126 RepID=A0ABN9PYN0_9DINO|nr:unnamed protein product [Polarella glacialis]